MDIQEQEVDILSYLRLIQNHKKLIGFITFLFVATAFIYTYIQTPLYKATTTLNFEKTNPNMLPSQDAILFDINNKSFFDTQVKLITSRTLARRVAEKLSIASDRLPRRFSIMGTIKSLFRSSRQNPDPVKNLEAAASFILGGISVSRDGNTNILKIQFTHPDPVKSALIADTIAQEYISLDIERKYNISVQANQFISRQLQTLQKEISEAETRLIEYGSLKDIVSLSEGRSNILIEQLGKLNADYTQAVTNRITLESYYNTIKNTPRDQIDEVARNSNVNSIKQTINSLEQRIESMREKFQPDYPELRRLEVELSQAKQNLSKEVADTAEKVISSARAQYESALQKEKQLSDLLEAQKKESQTLHIDAVEYQNLLSIVNNKRKVMDVLLQRQSETEISSQLDSIKSNSISIVDKAMIPSYRSSPNLRMNMLISLVLGFGVGFLSAFMIEYLDDSLKTPDDVERFINSPTLGIIPKYSRSASYKKGYGYSYSYSRDKESDPNINYPVEMITHFRSRISISESYRTLRTAVLLSTAKIPKKILVTSSLPSEGKTSTATNLAITLAKMGKKTLLVDTDLRRPKIYKIFNRKNTSGIVNHIVSGIPIEKIIQKTDIDDLYIVLSGPIPPQPSEMLISDQFVSFVENASKVFDHIIFDAPPVIPVTDPSIIAHITDTLILVVRAGETSRKIVTRAIQKLTLEKIKISGIVLNSVDMERSAYYYYKGRYKSYYHKYYTYGEDISEVVNGGIK